MGIRARRLPGLVLAAMVGALTGCTTTNTIDAGPSVPLLPEAGLPNGQFVVAVDEGAMVAEADREGQACPPGRYRFDLRGAFDEAAQRTVQQAVRTVGIAQEGVRDLLGRPSGRVGVMADNLVIAVASTDGMWAPVTRAQAALRATVRLRTSDGRTTEQEVAGYAETERSGGRACEQTDVLLAFAIQGAMAELMREVAIVVRATALAAEPPSLMVMADSAGPA